MNDDAPQPYPPNSIHLVRTAQQIQVQLSQMADHKASILMGATFVVFTIAINGAKSGALGLPMLVLGAFSFASAVLAVFAILPTVDPKPGASLNLLFFGSFTQIPEDEYLDRLDVELHSDQHILRTMMRDIYQNGTVLKRKKYRFLGYAYRVFLLGLVATVATFIIEYAGAI